MSVKKSVNLELNTSSQRRISGAVNDVMKISLNSMVSPAQRSIRAAHADPILAASALNATSSQAQRFVRAANDPLSAAVDKMQKVARLTTGIHIQLGLISGSIQSDPLISELLHLGSVTPSQIISMDSSKIQSAMTSIKELPGKLTEDASTRRTEEKLKALNVMRDMVMGITGDITTWPGKAAFEAEMDKVKANGVEVTIPEKVHSAVKSWNEKLKDIKTNTIDSSDPKFVSDMDYLVRALNKASVDLSAAITTLSSTADPKPWKITSATEALSPIIQAVNSVEHAYTGYNVLKGDLNDANHAKNYKSTYTNLSGTTKLVTDAAPGLQIFHVVSKSRGSPSTTSSGFPGFSNGFLDIDQLFVDLGDVWMGKVTDPKSMEAALTSLKTLTTGFESVDNTLGVTGDQRKKVIADFLDLVNGIRSVPTTEADYTAALGEYAGCSGKFHLLATLDVNPVKEFIASAEKLDNAVGEVDLNVQKLLGLLNTPEVKAALEEVEILTQSSNESAVLTQTVQKLTNTPSIVQLSTVLVAAEKILFDVNTNIKQLAGEVLSKTGSVDTFQSSIPEYPTFFNCLRDQITDEMAVKIGSVVGMAEKFRGADRTVLADGEAAVNGLVKSANDFKNLKTSVESLKGKSTADTKILEALPTSDKHSKTIGLATLGVSNMEMALEAKTQADVIIAKSEVVAKQMKLATDAGHVKNLGEVVKLKSSLPPMYTQLASWKTGIKPSDSTNLASFSDLYTSAKSVSGITGDFGAMAKSVEDLAKQVTDPNDKATLISVQKALEKLDSIDLNFASYSTQFDQSKDTLTALDLFFVDSKTPIASVTPAPKGPNGKHSTQPQPLASGQVGALTSTEASSDPTAFIAIGVVVGVGIIGAVGGVVYWKSKSKKEKSEKPNPDPAPTPNPPETKPDPLGPPPAEPQVPDAPQDAHPAAPAPKVPAPPPVIEPTQDSEMEVRDVPFDYNACNHANEEMRSYLNRIKRPIDEKYLEKYLVSRNIKEPQEISWDEVMQMYFERIWKDVERNQKKNENLALVGKHKNETRKRIALTEATRVRLFGYGDRFTNDYMHANMLTFFTGLRMILTQSPLKASGEKLSTMEKFWWMARQNRTKFIIMLNADTGGDQADYYFPRKKGETMKLKGLTVKCTDEVTKDLVITRKLKVQFDNDKEFEVTHMQHTLWLPDLAPADAAESVDMLKAVRLSNTPVIVHCTDGASRSGCFALIELGYQELMLNGGKVFDLVALVDILRSMRALALHHPVQLAFSANGILEMLSNGPVDFGKWYSEYHATTLTVEQKEYTTQRTKAGLDSKMLSGWIPKLFKMMFEKKKVVLTAEDADDVLEELLAEDLAEYPEMLAFELLYDMLREEAVQEYHRRGVMPPRPANMAIQMEPIDNIV